MSFAISYSTGLLVMNSQVNILPLISKSIERITGMEFWIDRYFSVSILKMSCHCFLICIVSNKKPVVILIFQLMYLGVCVCAWYFGIFPAWDLCQLSIYCLSTLNAPSNSIVINNGIPLNISSLK